MALLNPPSILPDLGFVVYRQLASTGGAATWDHLFQALVPNEEVFHSTRISPMERRVEGDPLNQTVRALSEIGFLEVEEEEVRLTGDVVSSDDAAVDRERYVSRITEYVMSNALSHVEVWSKEAPGATDLTRSLAFLLVQDPLRPCFYPGGKVHPAVRSSSTDLEESRLEHIGSGDDDAQVLHNAERWFPFVRWAVAMGFASLIPPLRSGLSSRQDLLIADPTVAVARALRRMDDGSYPVGDFLRELCSHLPVFAPFGAVFQSMAAHWKGELPIGGNDVPPALSHALLRCETAGLIELGRGSDAAEVARFVVQYPDPSGPETAEQVVRVVLP